MQKSKKVAVIGGGIAGASVALYLSEIGLEVSLFEKGTSLVNGPPICHLHAGGNLYREISDKQCVTLLKESIDTLRLFPDSIDYRPTVIAVPKRDSGDALALLPRLKMLTREYEQLIRQDANNEVLGAAQDYYRLFELQEMQALARLDDVAVPSTPEEWMIPIAKHVDLSTLKFPLVLVQEFGWNVFRLGASAALSLEKNPKSNILLNTKVNKLTHAEDKGWKVSFEKGQQEVFEYFDYIINAAGFKSGEIDDAAGFHKQRIVEFKAAYVTQWDGMGSYWPEVIFHGERGTPHGMAQFTPYPDNVIQIHGMTEKITLFDDGLIANDENSAQPKLGQPFLDKIYKGWSLDETKLRTQRAIEHIAEFIPSFLEASVTDVPLFGAQQIPGDDASLRAAGVSFEDNNYARCEIVKASSVLTCADEITKQLISLGYVNKSAQGSREFAITNSISDEAITQRALTYTNQRGYPSGLAYRNIEQTFNKTESQVICA
ncbi:FAD-dependent oxidoreductase [Vibrio sp. RC27]